MQLCQSDLVLLLNSPFHVPDNLYGEDRVAIVQYYNHELF